MAVSITGQDRRTAFWPAGNGRLPWTVAATAPAAGSAMNRRLDDDDALMGRIAAGDAAAFRRLMERHVDGAYRLARRVTGSRTEAEDAVQEAFLRVWTRAQSWAPGRALFSTWLWRVVLNLSLDSRRRRKHAPLEAAGEPGDPRPDAVDRIAEREQTEWVDRAVAALPERQRAALALVYGNGASNTQAAEALGISVGALEQLLVRAKRTLREGMSERER